MSNNENQMNLENRQPLKLLKNKSYPTYQLYATVINKINPEQAMIIAVLETMSWLRKRFRDLEIPGEIKFPEPDVYKFVSLDDFKSFRINEGYVVDVVFIRNKGIWAFHLIEPDMGPDPGSDNQRRAPVPGRVFETNIAFRIYNNKLECGFKTVCSEPADTKAICEVYRLAVVKSIANNKDLGLEQVLPITKGAMEINSTDRAEKIVEYIKSKERQLPFVLVVEYKRELNIEKLKIEDPCFDVHSLINRCIEEMLAITSDEDDVKIDTIEARLLNSVKNRMGYAQFGYLPHKYINYFNENMSNSNLAPGEVRIFYPERFKASSKNFKYDYIEKNTEKFINDLDDELQEYPKYKSIDYSNVVFINEARIEELQGIIKLSNSKEEVISLYEDKIKSILAEYNKTEGMLNNEIQFRNEKIERLKDKINKLEDKEAQWLSKTDEIKSIYEIQIKKLKQAIERKETLLARPRKTEDIPEWVNKYFSDSLIFHDRAINEICNTPTKEVNLDLLCDAIEYLAHEYRDEFIGKISVEERDKLCSERYNRGFIVEPSGEMNIKSFGKEYKIRNGISYTGKLKEVPLDLHLKIGNDNLYLIRIYFYYDSEKKLIVVGSLPKHLRTISEK